MSKPKYYKVAGEDKWVQSKHFSTRYIIKENKELERWDVVEVELPTVRHVPYVTKNPYSKNNKTLCSKDIKPHVDPDTVMLIDYILSCYSCNVGDFPVTLSEKAKEYAKLRVAELNNTRSTHIDGLDAYCGSKYYSCYVKDGIVEQDVMYIPQLTYATRAKAIEALTKRVANKALKGGAFKQDKARIRAENTLKWLLEQDDGDKING